ncbi:unnamed protein product [Chrysoparadoxa australica]
MRWLVLLCTLLIMILPLPSGGSSWMSYRGGSAAVGQGLRRVVVSTVKLSSFIDQRGEVQADLAWTVGELKRQLASKFPGHPPASMQQLFKGVQMLEDDMLLEDVCEGMEGAGPLQLLMDIAPPIEASKFDPDTVVPAKPESQLEAYSSSMAALKQLTGALASTMKGERAFASVQGSGSMATAVQMKADYDSTLAFLHRTAKQVPPTEPVEVQHGPLHTLLRPLARELDIDWGNTTRVAFFLYVCAKFGANGRLQGIGTSMLIPFVFLYQTRRAKVLRKIVWNLLPMVPSLPHLLEALLTAPERLLMQFDEEAYVKELYGEQGPLYHPDYLAAVGSQRNEEGSDSEELQWEDEDRESEGQERHIPSEDIWDVSEDSS